MMRHCSVNWVSFLLFPYILQSWSEQIFYTYVLCHEIKKILTCYYLFLSMWPSQYCTCTSYWNEKINFSPILDSLSVKHFEWVWFYVSMFSVRLSVWLNLLLYILYRCIYFKSRCLNCGSRDHNCITMYTIILHKHY